MNPLETMIEAAVEAAVTDHARRVGALCALAFQMDMRLAVGNLRVYVGLGGAEADFEHIMLSPGEMPPGARKWTIYENHGGTPVGRDYEKAG